MRITNLTKNTLIASRAAKADGVKARVVGLLNRSSLDSDEALIIPACQSIHMMFMKFAIDVIFVDRDDRVVGLVRGIKPFRLSPVFFKASYAVEGPVGMIKRSSTDLSDRIAVES